ncbi:hypothetical protein ABFV83_17210 [Lacrimispora sp. BS-2]|uniref:YcxB-like protein domain-containing protein n=1 Tax=Lacrimispora sp. BS-2 TaxID=3151850 RepID=A0AAU7PMB6_9FIRM
MKFTQAFTADTLAKLEVLFRVRTGTKGKMIQYGKKSMKLLYGVISVLYLCTILFYLLENAITNFMKVCFFTAAGATVYAIFLLWFRNWNRKRLQEVIRKKYGTPFSMELEKEHLIYREVVYGYKEITYIIFYDVFILIYVRKRILIIQNSDGISDTINKIIDENNNIMKIEQKAPFNLDAYFKADGM